MIDNRLQAPPSSPYGATGQVCNWANAVELEDIPDHIRTDAKYVILDGIGCALVGAQLPWSRTATKAVLDMEGPGRCTLFGWNQRLNPLSAAILNSTFIQGFELDDVHADAPWHANSVILPALFAAAEHAGRGLSDPKVFNGEAFLLSAIVGFEIGSRVGNALYGAEMLSRGWHGAVFGPAASAVAVSKLLDLSPEKTEDAIGTACTQACGLMSAHHESMAKRMQHGFAARNGLFAALMSKERYTGIDKVFERSYGGFLSTFGQGSDHEPAYLDNKLTDNLGEEWKGVGRIRIKPYASLIATHAPIDCIAALQEEFPEQFADPESICKVNVELSKPPFAHGGQMIERPQSAIGAQMSTRYTTAVQLHDRAVFMEQFKAENLNRESLWRIIHKVNCVWNPEFDKRGKWYTRVTVDFQDGKTVVKELPGPSTYERPLSNEDIFKKWRMLADSAIDAERRNRIESLVMNLEHLGDVSELIKLLETQVCNPVGED